MAARGVQQVIAIERGGEPVDERRAGRAVASGGGGASNRRTTRTGYVRTGWKEWWPGTGLNRRHQNFQIETMISGSARKLLLPSIGFSGSRTARDVDTPLFIFAK
jgi:hypothetical protein